MLDLSQVPTVERIIFYRKEIMLRTPPRNSLAVFLVKVYRNLLACALEGQQMDEDLNA